MSHQRLRTSALMILALAFTPACDGSDEPDPVGEGETGEGETGEGETGDGDGDGDTGTDTSDTKVDTDDTGELMGCAAIMTEEACTNEPGCGAVRGTPVVDDGAGAWCTLPEEEFIGCANSQDLCPMLGKTLCDGESVWRTTGCVPGNLVMCDPPGGITGPC